MCQAISIALPLMNRLEWWTLLRFVRKCERIRKNHGLMKLAVFEKHLCEIGSYLYSQTTELVENTRPKQRASSSTYEYVIILDTNYLLFFSSLKRNTYNMPSFTMYAIISWPAVRLIVLLAITSSPTPSCSSCSSATITKDFSWKNISTSHLYGVECEMHRSFRD